MLPRRAIAILRKGSGSGRTSTDALRFTFWRLPVLALGGDSNRTKPLAHSRGRERPSAEGVAACYTAVAPQDQPELNGRARLANAWLAAPVLGSRWLFPRRFDTAVATLLGRPGAGAVPLHEALWHFGSALRMCIDTRTLQARLSDFVEDARGPRWIGSYFLDSGE
jgi:hypothetical protein